MLLAACDDPPKEEPKAGESAMTAQPAAATVAPKVVEKEPEKPQRPKDIPRDLTQERRSVIEKAHPEAKGFLFVTDLEEKLKKDPKNTAKAAAMKSFDKKTKGKWLLFAGTLINPTDTGFDLAVTYTPLAPGDKMGISRQFFTVTLSDIEGYAKDNFKAGNTVAVIAKYSGDGKAGPGFELVAENHWE
jgi:hypothetical protein